MFALFVIIVAVCEAAVGLGHSNTGVSILSHFSTG